MRCLLTLFHCHRRAGLSVLCDTSLNSKMGYPLSIITSNVEFHFSGLIGTASHPDVQKIRIIGIYFENRLHWPFEVTLLVFTLYGV